MEIYQENQKDVTILRLVGELMGGPEAVKLNEKINSLLDEGQLKVVVDMGEVDRMNSSGLGILINAISTFKQNGGAIRLARISPKVQKLIDVTRLDAVFEIYPSVEDAIVSF